MIKKGLTISLLFTWLMALTQVPIEEPRIRYSYFQMLYHTGVYWNRSLYLKEKFEDGYKAFEMRMGFQTTGRKLWQQLNKYPSYGFGVHYADLIADPKDEIVGNPFSAFVFYSAPRARIGRFSLNTDLSLGLSYTSVVHDPVTNPENDVIASHVNLYFDFNVNLTYMLSDRINLKGGYGVTHYSNGRIQMPQKGVNNWGWNLGLSYHFVQKPKEPVQNNFPDHPSKNPQGDPPDNLQDYPQDNPQDNPQERASVRPEFIETEIPEFTAFKEIQVMYAAGVVEHHRLGDLEGIHYYTSSFSTEYALAFHPRMAVTFGINAFYDGSLAADVQGGIPPEEVTTMEKIYFGSHLGYQFFIDRVTILANFGTYFFQQSNERGFWFVRAGGRVRLTDHLSTQICIKTKNGIRSDWIEWGLAYAFKIGKKDSGE